MTRRPEQRRARLAPDVLVVDVGNSKVQALLVQAGVERLRWRVDYGSAAWKRGFAAAAALARGQARGATPIVLASVAPARAQAIDAILRRVWGRRAHHVDHRDPWPFALGIRAPWTLGADRLANVAGLCVLGLRSGIAVDAGTAVTIDVLARGRFVGGLILPGTALMAQALRTHTAQLPAVSVCAEVPLVGDATASALQAGIFHGLLHAVRGITSALSARLDNGARVVLTGGAAEPLAGALPRLQYEPDLLFLGLRRLQARRAAAEHRRRR